MRLYSGSSEQFIQDTIQNQIAEKLKVSFFDHFRFNPSPSEVNSWRNSLTKIKDIFQLADFRNQGVMVEYQLPLTSKRLDVLICGKDEKQQDNAVIIELKQWDKCDDSEGENEVSTFIGGTVRDVIHPSVQVGAYKLYLQDVHTAFYQKPEIKLNACAYLHNYNYYDKDILFSNKFHKVIKAYPLFTADDVNKLKEYLVTKVKNGDGLDVLKKVEQSKYRPSKKLIDHVSSIIKGRSEYVLLDEQIVVYDKILSSAKLGFHDKQKTVIIVKGGPGTGKSVIAINTMADLLSKGYNAQYATGSRAFTGTLSKIIGHRGAVQFRYFNSYTEAEENAIDVLICDEAHRIRIKSDSRFTPINRRSDKFQIEELIKASKVSVYFIDDDQVVRPKEIGSVEYINEYANKYNCKIYEYELEAQFRCNGSDAFVNWINNTLAIKKTANAIWENKNFDFRIFDTPFSLENAIIEKTKEGYSARMTAGFCWSWSKPNYDGSLVLDVNFGKYKRPWNAKPESRHLAHGIPSAIHWAYDPNGINQIGCIYTAQGFEFDYIGVIFGNDLIYNFKSQKWEGHPENSRDTGLRMELGQQRNKSDYSETYLNIVKRVYRVLLSRGLKGCYVYFLDEDTKNFFRSRIEN